AQNDQRIASDKISKLTYKIENLKSGVISENDARIFPGLYAPLIVMRNGERVIEPFRYQLRPAGESPAFDRKFNGTYNARRDRLQEVFWWKSLMGKSHGLLPISAFYENVKRHDLEHRTLRTGETEENLILKFVPESLDEMLVPCIFDQNRAEPFVLNSFALITDEPNPEVAAAGHDRTPIILKDENFERWLTPGLPFSEYDGVLGDKKSTYFEHSIAA
ncbi:MAG: hypothetical protein EOP04_23850, partial [Proteobacteria bacterium]